MAVETHSSGTTVSLTLNSELTLATIIATPGFYQLKVDPVGVMVDSSTDPDRTLVRVYTKVLSGGAERLEDEHPLARGAQAKAFRSKPYPELIHIRFAIIQTGGTGRQYPWMVLQW